MEATSDKNAVPKKPLSASVRWALVLCCCVGLAVLGVALFPVVNAKLLKVRLTAASNNGRDIYRAMWEANEKRKSVGLPPLWPKTCLATTNNSQDISCRTFKTSTEYFKVLFDEEHMGTAAWNPYVKGIDYSKLAGMGVPVSKTQRLTSTNNMWAIAANITEEDAAIIPVLISRNADMKAIEEAISNDLASHGPDVKIALGMGDYQTPFGDKGFVCVRKGGSTFFNISNYATTRVLFITTGMYRTRDPSKPPIVYLMP
jgi:hypothetical protein